MTVQISTISVEYVRSTVREIVAGSPVNPTGDAVAWAFLAPGSAPTASTTFYAGSWDSGGPPYVARCLIGPSPGVVQLKAGTYQAWIQVTDNPEVPVIMVPDTIQIV